MSSDQTEQRQRFYGRRKGHPLRQRQQDLIDHLLPRLRVEPDRLPGDLADLFPRAVSEVHLEIGFGGGEHLAHRARTERHVGFIGCEPFVNGVAKLLVAVEEGELDNVRVSDGDARLLLAGLPDASIDRIWMLYPDPWPKTRHRKRRLLNEDTAPHMARVLKPGGELRFATDIPDYADWTLRRVARVPELEWTAERPSDWREPWEGWPGTRYEAKAGAAGRIPAYLTFRRG
ncbi:tRNA (guanine(46)-N(7))-methyltransferase TrmB [Lutibaculum baratangense]|uniref:tRNA (guanine-N(7)-)-methyltransferase n=1 Tax=Lutibaculum baratangense AMV1 TaxID=631454 RepID=V4R1N5_9HYPH|nr:tRNA (guanine(46)-N(7))-methyltransferase TrmB [Lutibaculum baratangense]ESR25872.1 tRNA (guanine46-N7-)-methyltransferase [Lutibaculum baratangense AMV1]